MKHLFPVFLFTWMLALPFSLTAQQEFAMHAIYNHPSDHLKSRGLDTGWGINTEFLYSSLLHPKSSLKLRPGLRFDLSFNGSVLTHQTWVDSRGDVYDIRVGNSNIGGYGFLRLTQENDRLFQFYADGMLGFRWFMSSEGVRHPEGTCPDYDDAMLASRVTPSWGGSLGMLFRFTKHVALDFRANYLQGGRISFVDLSSVQPVDKDAYTYQLGSGIASQLMFQAGIHFKLSGPCLD